MPHIFLNYDGTVDWFMTNHFAETEPDRWSVPRPPDCVGRWASFPDEEVMDKMKDGWMLVPWFEYYYYAQPKRKMWHCDCQGSGEPSRRFLLKGELQWPEESK